MRSFHILNVGLYVAEHFFYFKPIRGVTRHWRRLQCVSLVAAGLA
jgi:hypothetical protein